MPYIGTSPSNGVRRVHTYTATASQTTFTGASSEGVTLSYADTNYLDVFQNGVLLGSADYTSTSGTSVVLAQGASASDLIVIVVYDVFSVADTVSKTNGGTFDGAVTVSGAFTSQGIDDNADAIAITIDSSENVGIGETTPQSKLHIKTADASATAQSGSALVIEGTDASRADLQFLGDASAFQAIYFGDNSDADIGRIAYDHTGNSMRFNTNASERMRIDSSGNVGIGNNNPADFGSTTDNLVIGTTSGENGMTIASGTGNSGRIQFADNTSSPFRGAIEYAHGTDFLFFYTNGSQQLKITNNGFIQSPPTSSNTTGSSANMHVTAGGEFAKSTSSKRYKNTINDATHGLAELLKLRSVTFKGNNDGDTIFGGLIAEEVHDAGLTEFVVYDEEDRPDALHYPHMIALCVKAIQELSAKVTTLETENATQATQIADLISRVTALENAE